jgi:hypothetical protein
MDPDPGPDADPDPASSDDNNKLFKGESMFFLLFDRRIRISD